ncbi:DUF4199 domain-containing protein [Aquimarina latercula]|uniref:DUF4199 domain-containing protein n=1 Tax=Aquimarina latercula TaxID=987 RepID=UPI00138ABC49|nr:DUF4199 domain-containing protein [Aquimarina latercula]
MKSKSIPIKTYILKYGAFLGVISVIFSLVIYLTGYYTNQNLFHYLILFLIIVFSNMLGLIAYKKKNEFISLKEALKIGIGITMLGGLIAILWKIMLMQVIDPEIITQLENKQIKRIAEVSKDLTQENIDRKIAITQKFTSPLVLIGIAIVENFFIGFFLSLIVGLVIRKKRDPFK